MKKYVFLNISDDNQRKMEESSCYFIYFQAHGTAPRQW